MSVFNVISLLGGLALFLYGMRLMGDSLKENSGATMKLVMEKVTDNPIKAFFLGMLITALIQSSTATIVITSGLVGAGILTLHQSLGIIIGANVGTTVTGQIIRLLDLNASGGTSFLRYLQPSTLAPVALIIGMVLIMSGVVKNAKSIGNIAVGFGILFTGLMNMTGAVKTLTESGIVEKLFSGLGDNPVLGYLTGAGVAFALQSSSATIGILQAFSAGGVLTFKAIYAVIVGIYLGDCVTTAIVCSIGARAEAKRVGVVNILFNLSETVVVLVGVNIAHKIGLLDGLWDATVNSGIIANTNTIFNLACAILLFPMIGIYEKLSKKIIPGEPEKEDKYKAVLEGLNPAFFNTPMLSLRSCYELLLAMFQAARTNLTTAFHLLETYNQKSWDELMTEEGEIDRMTDRLSHYMVELSPHLHQEVHASILNQYYKVNTEFERLGDHAVNIADSAAHLAKNNTSFSPDALREIEVLRTLIDEMLDHTGTAFRKRSLKEAEMIEPLVRVSGELINQMQTNHFRRMGQGVCSLYADAAFSNLMGDCKRIGALCSNVGIAVLVRAHPELADHEHLYFENLQNSGDGTFNKLFEENRNHYFALLNALPETKQA